jgi:membrane protein required for colicin V production
MPITWLDIVVLAFMLISALLAMARGFTRELLSILSWVAAALVTLWAFPRYQGQMRALMAESPKWLADIVLVFSVFLVTLIVVSFITIKIADKILDSRAGALDRTFGFVFGLARGLVIIVIAYLFFTWLVPEQNMPEAVRTAKSKPLLDYTGETIRRMLPEDPSEALSRIKPGRSDENAEEPASESGPGDESKNEDSRSTVGYKRNERQGLDQLMESTRGAEGLR